MKTITLTLFALIACINNVFSQAEPPAVNSILWEISGKDLTQKSYLLGTFHGFDATIGYAYLDTLPKYKEIFESVEAVATEIDSKTSLNSILKGIKDLKDGKHPVYALMPDSVTCLRDIFESQEEYLYVDTFMQRIKNENNFFLLNPEKLKPYYTTEVLGVYETFLSPRRPKVTRKDKGFQMMDDTIESKAKENGKRVFYMETIEDLTAAQERLDSLFMDTCSLERQSHLLYVTCKNLSRSEEEKDNANADDYIRKLEAWYLQGNLSAALRERNQVIEKKGQSSSGAFDIKQYSEDYLRVGRNKNWIPVIEKNVHQSSCLIAVGALHLPGENGLINMLRKEGYTLTPIDPLTPFRGN